MKNQSIIHQFLMLSFLSGMMGLFSCGAYLIPPDPRAQDPAEEALKLFEALANEHTYKKMGFESLEEVSSAALGEPISVFTIHHNTISAYQNTTDPNILLIDRHEILYPVMVNGQIRSSIGIMHDGKIWEYSEIGRPNFTGALFDIRQLHMRENNKQHTDYFLVNFPSLYVTLIGHVLEDKTYQMAIVHGHEHIDLQELQFIPANKSFAALAAYAKVHPAGGIISD